MANGLGRGLGSLIPQKQNNNTNPSNPQKPKSTAPTELPIDPKDEKGPKGTPPVLQQIPSNSSSMPSGKPLELDIERIKVNPFQPRKRFTDFQLDELIASIKEYGIIQPLIVTRKGDNYELIAGERRFRASKKLGLKKVPVVVREADNKEKLELAIIENLQRENLNPIDLGMAYKQLMDEFELTQEEVAKRMSKSRSSVTNTMRMLSLPEEIKLALIEGRLTEGHAKYIMGVDGEEKQMLIFRKIIHNNLSVKDTHKEVGKIGGTKAARIPKPSYEDQDREFALREFFGAKVQIKRKAKGGEVVISFFSDDELKEIIAKIK